MNKSRPVTLQSLARQLGLNVSTVSRVLNGSGTMRAARPRPAPSSVSARWRPSCATRPIRTPPASRPAAAAASACWCRACPTWCWPRSTRRGRSRRRTRLPDLRLQHPGPAGQAAQADRHGGGAARGRPDPGRRAQRPGRQPQSAAGGAGRARRALRAGQPPCRRALRGNLRRHRGRPPRCAPSAGHGPSPHRGDDRRLHASTGRDRTAGFLEICAERGVDVPARWRIPSPSTPTPAAASAPACWPARTAPPRSSRSTTSWRWA